VLRHLCADFWRNKARIEHEAFVTEPSLVQGCLVFATRNRLVAANATPLATLISRFEIAAWGDHAFALTWQAEIRGQGRALVFGDQEEMGLGVVAQPGLRGHRRQRVRQARHARIAGRQAGREGRRLAEAALRRAALRYAGVGAYRFRGGVPPGPIGPECSPLSKDRPPAAPSRMSSLRSS
jgi:hypothetical protein